MSLRFTIPPGMRRPRAVLATGLLALAMTAATIVLPTSAFAHGSPTSPGSRTYLCYKDGLWNGGDLNPRNQACASAIAAGGKQPLWDWFGVLRSDGAGRTTGFIPDGQLCSGGNPKYDAYNEARADWPGTRLTSGAPWTIHYNAWAAHPGGFRMYITKDGYDPTKPLKWSDLESAPFSTWSETTPNGTGEYYWDTTLPANKTGRHIIYSVWTRTDSQETFYGCSDVVFDGGNGELIGMDGTSPTPTPSATTSSPNPTTPKPTTPNPTTANPTPSNPPTTAPVTPTGTASPPPTGQTCIAQVATKTWSGGYLGTVTVMNRGPARSPWNVGFTVPAGVKLFAGWNADVKQSGTTVTATAPAWNASLASGAEVSIGFIASGPSSPAPSGVKLNGIACGTDSPGGDQSAPTSSAVPATTPGGNADGFENQTGTTPSGAWTVQSKDCSGEGKATIDAAVAHTGSKSLRIDGAAGFCNHVFVGSTKDLSTLGSTVFARMYVKHTTEQPVQHTTFIAMKDTSQNGKDLRIGGQNKALQWNRESDDATLPAQSPAGVAQSTPLPTGTWQCLEIEVNGSNGTAHTWLNGAEVKGLTADGTPTMDVDNQWYGTSWKPAITDLRLGWESYGEGADTLWYDDVAIDTSRIGC